MQTSFERTLKPCPFCGGKAEMGKLTECLWIVGCNTLMCLGNINHASMYFVDAESAVETWNRRANDVTSE